MSKDDSGVRPIGISMGEPHILHADDDLRRAIESKAKKYGALPLSLIVAVNAISEHCDEIDINNALFGTETVRLTTSADGSHRAMQGQRLPDGIWFGTKGVRNQTVSAVLVGNYVDKFTCGVTTPLLVHHPNPTHNLTLASYPLSESVHEGTTHSMKRKEGRNAKEFLRLPDPWPPVLD